MFKQLLSDKRIFGAIVCVIVFVAGGLLYLNAVKQKAARDVQRTQETITQQQTPKTEAQPQNPIVSETEHGHTHADGTFHAQPHEVSDTPTEGGHWSEAYLPPIEELEVTYADDTEAMFILDRVKILLKHQRDGFGHNPDADKAFAEMMNFTNELISSIGTEKWSPQRSQELLKLRWYIFDTPPSSVIFENEGGIVE